MPSKHTIQRKKRQTRRRKEQKKRKKNNLHSSKDIPMPEAPMDIEMPIAPDMPDPPTREELIQKSKKHSRAAHHDKQKLGQTLRKELGLGKSANQAQVMQAVMNNPALLKRLVGDLAKCA